MKITIDEKTGIVKKGNTEFKDLKLGEAEHVIRVLERALYNNSKLSEWDIDSMWMSYRYCIGRHTIASHSRAGDIAKHCYGRMSKEKSIFNAYDMNRCIEDQIRFFKVNFWFPLGPQNRIYTSALDIFCQFIEDFNITTKEELLKYKDVHIKLADNERGYVFETVTWEEWLRPQILELCKKVYNNDAMSEDFAWNHYQQWLVKKYDFGELGNKFTELIKNMPNIEHFYLTDIDDLMVWNDLVHLFDIEHHHKSILTDGTECEWFWTYTHDTYKCIDEYSGKEVWRMKEIGYRKIRVPVDKFNGITTCYIPDEAIKKDLY